ncbi:MAG TPA: hypothetical protein VLL52_15960, partial [Anaerolineae bacterium]|nr:hypothetical protein [Anaerolineae bacterium]
VAELRHGEVVWLVAADDAVALREGVEQVLGDRGLQERLGAGAKGVSEMFTWDKIAAETVRFFKGLGE